MVGTLTTLAPNSQTQSNGFSPKPDFARVYEDHWLRIVKHLLIKTRNLYQAEDLAGEVFRKALEKYESFQMRSEPQLSAWIFRIAHNVYVSHIRRERVVEFVELEEAISYVTDGVSEAVEQRLDKSQLRLLAHHLSEGQQLVIALTIFFDFSTSGIARIIGISDSNVKVRKHKATENLKRLFFGNNHDNGGSSHMNLTVSEIIQVTKEVLDSGVPKNPVKVPEALATIGYTYGQYNPPGGRGRIRLLARRNTRGKPITRDQFLALKVAKTLEERGHKLREIVQVWTFLPEFFFERVIEETPHVSALQTPEVRDESPPTSTAVAPEAVIDPTGAPEQSLGIIGQDRRALVQLLHGNSQLIRSEKAAQRREAIGVIRVLTDALQGLEDLES